MSAWNIFSWYQSGARAVCSQLQARLPQVCMEFSVSKLSTEHPAREVGHILFFSRLHARHVASRERSAVANPRRRSSDRKVERSPQRLPRRPNVCPMETYPRQGSQFCECRPIQKRHIWLPCLVLLPGGSVRPLGGLSGEADRDLNIHRPPSSALELPVIVVSQSGGRLFRSSWILHEGHKRRLKNLP